MNCVLHPGPRGGRRSTAGGSVLVEFALVSLAFYLLLAAVVSFGMQLHTAQVAQDAARLGARELALTPLPAGISFEDALVYKDVPAGIDVRATIYDPDALVIDLDDLSLGGPTQLSLDEYFARLPSMNRALRPIMIHDQIHSSSLGIHRLLRVPGALVLSATPPADRKPWFCRFSVAVPAVIARTAQGVETIEWHPVVEEVRPHLSTPVAGPFSVLSTGPDRGLVALRVNVPVQSSAMAAFQQGVDPFAPNGDKPVVADDAGVVESVDADHPSPGVLVGGRNNDFLAYDGKFGLGHVQALGKELRPYRRLITAQALFRREVFAEQSQ